ncbi:amidohydrolase family protein [Prauserella muralis]|uniref:Hydrolase n=1 Tax=Prauserella muralis TaxID=588067 RepID=A0A2V4AN80_9PSEU|nr:amidohydrolase family protein [Prauserella muralis]PXY22143.1 hydrolase [Prauserella muralis]TWE27742.1 putative TIM-barrel fold metal-dependent hydrolase [Prauserella muralis]
MSNTAVAEAAGRTAGKPGYTIVDADIHPSAPAAEIRARLTGDHLARWDMFGSRVPGPPEIYPRVRNAGFRLDAWPEQGPPGSDLRLIQDQLLDEFEVDHGILIPLQGHSWGAEEPEYAAALCRALNDWQRDALLGPEPRLHGSIAIPMESPDLAAEEIALRADDPRFVQILLSTGGELGFGRRRYWPIYAAAQEAGLPIAAHTGGLEQHRGAGWPSFYLEEHVWNGNMMAALILSMVSEGVFDRFPDLQVICVEGGIAWAGPLMWALDDAWERLRTDVPHLRKPPSEYVREHFWFTTQPIEEPDDPGDLEITLGHVGMNERIMFASDYPHWDFDSPRHAPRVFPAALRTGIMGANACRLYGLADRAAEAVR